MIPKTAIVEHTTEKAVIVSILFKYTSDFSIGEDIYPVCIPKACCTVKDNYVTEIFDEFASKIEDKVAEENAFDTCGIVEVEK